MAADETGSRPHDETTRSRMEALIAAMRRPVPAPAIEPAYAFESAPATVDDDRLAAVAWQAMQRGAELELGAWLGRYMPIEELGRGGMGRVLRAYDPKLQREVALKLLNPEAVDELGGARMVREARSMARLRHPNVVAVYDVDDDPRHGVVLAMELVEGCTLRAWLQERPRAWPEVLQVFLEAGRGLAAAHHQGLLHRDFKPANVLVGHDGRVEVSDFGLAKRSRDEAEPITGRISPLVAVARSDDAETLTEDGAVMGTPLYMAPEQHRGEPLTSAADQYAFCVALWEALHGERPFEGRTPAEQVQSAREGKLRAPSKPSTVPRWLRRACERGLAIDPALRWPSMDALLGALAKGRSRARVRRGLAAVGMLVLLGGSLEAYRRYAAAQTHAACEASGDEILSAWSPPRAEALREALMATGVSYAATTAEKVMPWLDRQAAAWQGARVEACLDADVRGRWSTETLERSRWCLDERHTELESLVDELTAADAQVVSKAVSAVAGLDSVEPCRDERVLDVLGLPPPEQREAIRAGRAAVTRAGSLEQAGRYDEGLVRAEEARAEADALEWPPLMAAARLRQGSLLTKTGDLATAETTLEDAYFEALGGVAPEVAFDAAVKLAFVVGVSAARPADGRRWGRLAAAARASLGDHDRLRRAVLLGRLGDLHMVNGAYDEAQAAYERSLALDEEIRGPAHPGMAAILNNLAVAHKSTGAYGEAKVRLERVIAVREEALGPRHPEVAQSLHNLADVQWATGDFAGARSRYEQALAIREEALGARHPEVGQTLDNLAAVYAATGDHARAKAASERGLAILEVRLGPEHPSVATSLGILASIQFASGAHAEAKASCERALAIFEARLGPEHPRATSMLVCLAEVALAQARPRDAIPLAQRAMELRERAGVGVDYMEEARVVLARALWDAPSDGGQDRAKAVTLAERARDAFRASDGAWPAELAAVEAWLASHPRP